MAYVNQNMAISDRETTARPAPRLLDLLRERIRARHYSLRTEQAYVHWAKRFILYHHKRHPKEMGAAEVEAFLSHLANEGGVSASTHQQALSALLFLYKEALAIDLPWLDNLTREKAHRDGNGGKYQVTMLPALFKTSCFVPKPHMDHKTQGIA